MTTICWGAERDGEKEGGGMRTNGLMFVDVWGDAKAGRVQAVCGIGWRLASKSKQARAAIRAWPSGSLGSAPTYECTNNVRADILSLLIALNPVTAMSISVMTVDRLATPEYQT
jgi:hypothetical protein